MKPILSVTVHRLADGALSAMGDERLLYRHPDASIEDEDQIRITTGGGGVCWVAGAGLGQAHDRPKGVHIDVIRSSSDLIRLIYDYVKRNGYVVAVWQTSAALPWRTESPVEVLSVAFDRVDTPQHWPNPRYTLNFAAFATALDARTSKRHLRSV